MLIPLPEAVYQQQWVKAVSHAACVSDGETVERRQIVWVEN